MVSQYVLRGGCCATPPGTSAPPTATSSRPARGGPSAACDWPGIPEPMTYTIDVHLSPEEVRSHMRADALTGLRATEKSIPPVWFYDERGSRLFEEITAAPRVLPDPGRAGAAGGARPGHRRAVQGRHARRARARERATRPGSCSTALQETGTLTRYVPFDVSDEFLRSAATTLSEEFDAPRHPSGHRRLPPAPGRDPDARAAAWSRSWAGPSAISTRPSVPASSSTSTAPCRATTRCSSARTWSRTGRGWWRPTTTPPA